MPSVASPSRVSPGEDRVLGQAKNKDKQSNIPAIAALLPLESHGETLASQSYYLGDKMREGGKHTLILK